METAQFGNLIGGLEGYLGLPLNSTTGSTGNAQQQQRRSAFASGVASIAALTGGGFALGQRVVSGTSSTFPASLAAVGRREEAVACGYQEASGTGAAGAGEVLKKKISSSNGAQSSSKKNKSNNKKSDNWTPPPMKSRKK